MTRTYNGHQIFTIADGNWKVGVLCSDGKIAIYDHTRYASEATATLETKRQRHQKPFINFVVTRA